MPLFKVPVTAYAEAATAEDAMTTALDGKPGRRLIQCTGPAEELDPEHAAAVYEFAATLNVAMSAPRELYVDDPEHPGVRLSPMAAATLRRLREND
jgi:hypothetical protein